MTETILAFIPSPSQGVWHIGPVPIRAYALCIIAGIVSALILGDRRWVARGGEQGVIYDIALLAVPFGLVGGRLYHVMTDWKTYFGDGGAGLGAAFRIWDGGLGIWGAVALGAVGAWIGCRMRGIPLPAFGDAIAPGIILAQAIGRLGNYFNQELYGRATTLPWGLEIYERRDASGALNTLNGVSDGQLVGVVHPTFLYELLWNLLIFALLLWIDKRFNMGHGRLFALYVAGYCVGRFWIELMRSDPASMPVDGIRVNTFTSTFVFVAAVVYVMVAPKGKEDPESLRGKQDEDSPVDDLLAKELATVAAASGVVAAATVAGADEAEDAAAVGDSADADVAEEAEAADEAEEPVDADTLEVVDDSAEPQSSDVGFELEKAAESLAVAESASEAEPDADAEPETGVGSDEDSAEVESAVVEPPADGDEAEVAEPPADGDESTESVGDDEPDTETAEGDSADSESSDVGSELEKASESLAAAKSTEPVGDDEPEADETAVEAGAEVAEGDSDGVEPAEAESADEAEADAETEVAESDTAEDESAEAESSEDAEAPVGGEEPETEAVEGEPTDDESAEAEDAPAADTEPEAEAVDSAADNEPKPEVKPQPAAPPPVTSGTGRKPRWWRRNR
ncbi:prolipoprotein diacylglyceryl transferase [Mycobacterium sp. BMJ-28]